MPPYELFFFSSAKIKNIISTEEAKAKLLAEQRNKKKDHGTSFVPTNIAVNYVQHNRCMFLYVELSGPFNGGDTLRQRDPKADFVFLPQSITRMQMLHRGTTDTEKSPKHGRCVWETLRNQPLNVRNYGTSHQ